MGSSRKLMVTRWPVLALALGGLALLIWLKLRVVTGIPRTAYAEPRDEAAAGQGPTVHAPDDAATLGTLSSSGPGPR